MEDQDSRQVNKHEAGQINNIRMAIFCGVEEPIMLEKTPSTEEMESLIGAVRFKVWTDLCAMIDRLYDMERLWNSGGKAWKYEYKYRRGGKTICALYARDNCC